MPTDEPFYDVQDRTGNPAHATVDEVVEHVLAHSDANEQHETQTQFDERLAEIVERHGSEAVETVIHRILLKDHPYRTATVGLEMRNAEGVWIGTAAVQTLRALNRQKD